MIADFILEKILNSETRYSINLDRICDICESSNKLFDEYKISIDEISHLRNSLEDLLRKYPKDHYTIKEIFEIERRNASTTQNTISMIILAIIIGCLIEYDSNQKDDYPKYVDNLMS